jgi:phosphatidylglycerophosphate synthase
MAGRDPRFELLTMDVRILESQKARDVLDAFWARKVSRHITALLIKTPITPNQTTVLWGVVSAMNSYVVYRVLVGDYVLLPVIQLVYMFTFVLDCVDGEIARVRKMANPVAGKLLDGICHRATEYSLLAAYVYAANQLVQSSWVLPIALLLLSGEAMHTYAYERRLSALRIGVGFTGLLSSTSANMYTRDERWRDLSWSRRIATVKGQLHYKSIYFIIALGYVSGTALLVGLGLLALYKHVLWIRLIMRTVAASREQPSVAPPTETAAPAPQPV